jgi:hypothetical protein
MPFREDDHDAEFGADGNGLGKNTGDRFGHRIGRDVEVFGGLAEEQVAHAAAHEIGLVAFFAERLDDADCGLFFVQRLIN